LRRFRRQDSPQSFIEEGGIGAPSQSEVHGLRRGARRRHALRRTLTRRSGHPGHASTTTTSSSVGALANLPVRKATISCAELAGTTKVDGLALQVADYQVGSYAKGDPQYCALTGHIATYIGSRSCCRPQPGGSATSRSAAAGCAA
jgi:hypothetical protein